MVKRYKSKATSKIGIYLVVIMRKDYMSKRLLKILYQKNNYNSVWQTFCSKYYAYTLHQIFIWAFPWVSKYFRILSKIHEKSFAHSNFSLFLIIWPSCYTVLFVNRFVCLFKSRVISDYKKEFRNRGIINLMVVSCICKGWRHKLPTSK